MKYNFLSVWHWEYSVRHYLTHPWEWFKELGWNIRNAWDRTTKGYCCTDWMNFDMWFKQISPAMLRDMAMHGHAYPGVDPFDDPEQWHSWLHRMADQITKCQDEDSENEYYERYMELLEGWPQCLNNELPELTEIRQKYQKRLEEINKEHSELFAKTIEEMLEHWDCLWD